MGTCNVHVSNLCVTLSTIFGPSIRPRPGLSPCDKVLKLSSCFHLSDRCRARLASSFAHVFAALATCTADSPPSRCLFCDPAVLAFVPKGDTVTPKLWAAVDDVSLRSSFVVLPLCTSQTLSSPPQRRHHLWLSPTSQRPHYASTRPSKPVA